VNSGGRKCFAIATQILFFYLVLSMTLINLQRLNIREQMDSAWSKFGEDGKTNCCSAYLSSNPLSSALRVE